MRDAVPPNKIKRRRGYPELHRVAENTDMSQPVFTTSTETDRTGRRYFALIVPIVLAAICLWMAMPKAVVSRGVGFQPANGQPENLSSSVTAVSGSNAIPVSLPAASPKLITRPIEDITPGMRVLASNPEQTETLADADVTAEDWRLVSLTMLKEDGGTLRVQLLRPIEWLVTEIVVLVGTSDDPQSLYSEIPQTTAAEGTPDYKLQRLLIGQQIQLDLPELGAQGPATVTAIDPCPSLDKPQAGCRLVTGTFRHSAANVVDLQVGRESEPFGCTDNHPFWSVDREQFVEAGQLQIGENLQTADGTITQVTRITPRRGPPVEVYNFEVDAEHVYHVGTSGVLVHNACDRGPIHHIATHYGAIGTRLKSLFAKADMSIQSSYNKVRIPGHVGPHGWYNEYILDRLTNAVGNTSGSAARTRLINELMELRWQLKNTDLGDLLRAAG